MKEHRSQSGFTLIELIMSIIVVAAALLGVLSVINQTTAKSADPLLRHQANAVAQAYLEEILLRPFCDPNDFSTDCAAACTTNACSACSGSTTTGGGPETRSTYDDVCDYHAVADNGCNAAGNGACNQLGNPIAGLDDYDVSIQVDDSANLNGLAGASGEVVLVTVTATHRTVADIQVALSGYRANY